MAQLQSEGSQIIESTTTNENASEKKSKKANKKASHQG
jgi:hypothetical protein